MALKNLFLFSAEKNCLYYLYYQVDLKVHLYNLLPPPLSTTIFSSWYQQTDTTTHSAVCVIIFDNCNKLVPFLPIIHFVALFPVPFFLCALFSCALFSCALFPVPFFPVPFFPTLQRPCTKCAVT